MNNSHIPVLAQESIELLQLQKNDIIIDATVGLGGHSLLFLKEIGTKGVLHAIDTDNENLILAKRNLAAYKNIHWHHSNFSNIAALNIQKFNALFSDLGMSSLHIDLPERGFSYRSDGPLDLRLNRDAGETAAQWLESATESEIIACFYKYGDIRGAVKIAKKIKELQPVTTLQLAGLVESVYTFKAKQFLPKVFQALRIVVNQELAALEQLLQFAKTISKGGRIAIISFHSLEDRLVKNTFKDWCTDVIDEITGQTTIAADFEYVGSKFIKPTASEITKNPRSRSATLRMVQKKLTATL